MTEPFVVVVDDEADLRDPVVEYLREEGLAAEGVSGGADLDALMGRRSVDLVVLDINMPQEDGLSIGRRLRAAGPVGIIYLTAKRDLIDRVAGLELGADDYLTKPFEPRELLARIRSVLRRTAAPASPGPATDYPRMIRATVGGVTRAISVEDIDWVEASRDYLLLHMGDRTAILRATISGLEEELDPASFVRIHRSMLVNRARVTGVSRRGERVVVQTSFGAALPVGPSYVAVAERLRA